MRDANAPKYQQYALRNRFCCRIILTCYSLGLVSFLCLVSWKLPLYQWPIYGLDSYSGTLAKFLNADFEAQSLETIEIHTTPTLSKSDERTEQVRWDNYSLMLLGQRIFLHSGEFHTFRLPVPSLWLDILQKIKAAGLNAISVYTHMGLINPAPGVIDFYGFRDLQPLFDAAKQSGIWIILRPGPYINAETTAGGLAHWVTSQVAGTLRTNATDFQVAWKDYILGIINATVPNQITNGGPVIAIQIDNEYFQGHFGQAEYFQQLEDVYHKSNIVVPLTYNDPGQKKYFVNGTGAVDIYGLDAYPQGFDCSNPTRWHGVTTNYHNYHENTNPGQPLYFPEFQGGSYDAWGPTAPGYESCRTLTGTDFQSVFNLNLWAANAKLINYYMVYGGTSWGAIPFHGVYTSYDYGSAIAENRNLTPKYNELKRQGLFLRSSPEFYKTEIIGNTSSGAVTTNSSDVFVTFLRNPDSFASFYIVRHTISTSKSMLHLRMNVTTSAGDVVLPQIVPFSLEGRQSKIVVTDYTFGTSKLLYATAQILFAGQIGGRDILFLYGDSTQAHEVSLILSGPLRVQVTSSIIFTSPPASDHTVIGFLPGIDGLVTVHDSDQQLILYSDMHTAATFWAPVTPSNSSAFTNYWQFGTNDSVLVGGPYLVRSASIVGTELALRGDLHTSVRLTVIAPDNIKSIRWNGDLVCINASLSATVTVRGGFVGDLRTKGSAASIVAPTLNHWKFADSLPEIRPGYSDASWTVANSSLTKSPYKPYYGDRVLYGCDYEFCENIVLWRGHFFAMGHEHSVNLSINGGEAFAASVWLNGIFLNTSYGNSTNNKHVVEETDDIFYFPEGSLLMGQDNVITIVQDNMGLNETDGACTDTSKSPRGIRGFHLNTGTFSEWKVQGKVGGYTNYPDKVRGVFNEGGLFGERQGWHLPGFDTSSWVDRNLSSGLPDFAAGVGFFVSTFNLHIPVYNDVFLSFVFDQSSQPYRAYLFINGWMMGKRIANLGPQFKFPVHQGILDYNGTNTVAVALWVMEPNVTVLPTLELVVDGVLEGGVTGITVDNPRWSSRDMF